MKQLIIFDEITKAGVYGIGTYIREVVESLHDKYKIIIVIYNSKEEEYTVKEEINHLELRVPSPQDKPEDDKTDERYFINSVYLISDFIKPEEEVIFHFNYYWHESFVDVLRKRFPSAKMVFTVHYMYWCFLVDGNTEYFKEIIAKPINERTVFSEREVFGIFQFEKAFLNKMDYVCCLSAFTRALLVNEYQITESKIFLLNNGLKDDGMILSDEEKAKEKKSLGLPPDSKIFLFVGRIDKLKGLEYVIRAFKKLYQQRSDCFLIVVGDGDYDPFLHESEGCRFRIIFTGKIDKEQVYRYYRIADAGVLLSKHEQCSYVAIEMMMHGLPVIASNAAGLGEMVADGVNGYKIQTIRENNTISFDIDNCCERLAQVINILYQAIRFQKRILQHIRQT